MSDVPQVDDAQGNGAQTPHSMKELQDAQQAAVSAEAVEAQPSEGTPKPPTHLEPVDRLEAENLHLRVLISAYKEKDLKHELTNTQRERLELQKKIIAQRDALSAKYQVDFTQHEVREGDGAIIPKGQSGVDMQKVLTQMAVQQQPTQG